MATISSIIQGYTGNVVVSATNITPGNLTGLTSLGVSGTTSAQHINPSTTNSFDLGTASLRLRNIFTQDLQLSNGIGDYTIVEGEDDLFIYNNKKGKVYKFALIEVDSASAPPKNKMD
jgi:hypothetical protein